MNDTALVSHTVEIRNPPPGYRCFQYRVDGGEWRIGWPHPFGRWQTRREARRYCRSLHEDAAIERWTWTADAS